MGWRDAPEVKAGKWQDAPLVEQPQGGGFRASTAGRLLQGVADPVIGTAQLLAHQQRPQHPINDFIPNIGGLKGGIGTPEQVDAKIAANEQAYQQARQQAGQTGFDWMRLSGNIASPANLIPGAVGLAGRGASLPTRIGAGAAAGSTSAVMQPVTEGDYATEKGNQALGGAAVGGAVPVVGSAVSRALNPAVSKNAQTLLDEGIPLTTGRRLGKAASAVEDKMRSWPIVGNAITSSHNRMIEGFNRSAANRALSPIGRNLPDSVRTGSESVGYVADTLGAAYDDVLSRISAKPTQRFMDDVSTIARDTVAKLPPDQRAQFASIVQPEIAKFGSFGNFGANLKALPGDELKRIGRVFREWGDKLSRSPDPNTQEVGSALRDTKRAFDNMIARANPVEAPRLKAIDRGYAAYARIRDAASSTTSVDGVFSPAAFQQAVRRGDKSAGKGEFARGRALLKGLSNAAKDIIPTQVPNSGTVDRALLAGGALGYISPEALTGLLAGGAAYTKPGQAFLNGFLFSRPDLLRRLSPGVAQYSPLASGLAGSLVAQNYGGP